MHKTAYDLIVWDWNGTLLDDTDFALHIINGMLERRGLPVRDRLGHGRIFDFPVVHYYQRLGFDFTREPFEQLSLEFVAAYYAGVGQCALRSGTKEALGLLSGVGLRQIVLSASRQDLLETMIAAQGLTPYFEQLLGIDSVHAPGKMERGREWMRDSRLDPARVLLLGDTVHDAEVAEAMGVSCWLLTGGHHPQDRLEATGCRCFSDLGAVAEALLAPGQRGRP